LRSALREGGGTDPRRREQSRPGVPGRGGESPLHQPGLRGPGVRLRRERIRGFPVFLGTHDPRPCPPGGGPGDRRGGEGRDGLRPSHGTGGGNGGDPGCGLSLHGPGPPGKLGHRGGHVGDSPGPCLHGKGRDREIRGLLSRPQRRPSGEGGLRSRHPGHPRESGRSRRIRRADGHPSLQRHGSLRGVSGTPGRPHRRGHRRARCGKHGSRAPRAGIS